MVFPSANGGVETPETCRRTLMESFPASLTTLQNFLDTRTPAAGIHVFKFYSQIRVSNTLYAHSHT